jgi:F0F1-type ATP synthase assembly protein I
MTTDVPAAAASRPDAPAAHRGMWKGLDHASVMSMELISAVLLWAGLGHLLDRWLGTDPWFLAIGALVGNAAGIYLVWLRSGRIDAAEAAAQVTTQAAASVGRP